MKSSSILPLGTFKLESSSLRVTDPCYKLGTWCAGTLENCAPGSWNAVAEILDNSVTGWGDRVSELIIWNSNYDYKNMRFLEKSEIHVGVDSGQAGFFDFQKYPTDENEFQFKDDKFYGKVCKLTLGEEEIIRPDPEIIKKSTEQLSKGEISFEEHFNITDYKTKYTPTFGGTLEFGVVSSSGYGDGGYSCYVEKNSEGKIIGAKIVFITDEPYDEEEEYD